jgi:hypothetical protein
MRRFQLPLLGSNQDSPDPESVPPGLRFRPSCPETVTYRASVPAFLPQNAGFCPEKRVAETVALQPNIESICLPALRR